MSLVISLKLKGTIIFACDGFALLRNKEDGFVKKLETRSKLAIFDMWQMVIGYVGETEALVDIVAPIYTGDFLAEIGSGKLTHETRFLLEEEFLRHLGSEMRNLDTEDGNNRLLLVCGYFNDSGHPVVTCFDPDGSMYSVNDFICIGSGAEISSRIIADSFSVDMDIEDAVTLVIDSIYEASDVPTVNALPMIVIIKPQRIIDLTAKSVEKYEFFKKELKCEILNSLQIMSD